MASTDDLAIGADRLHVRPHHADTGRGAQAGELELKLPRLPDVVRVKEGEEATAGLRQRAVARATDAGVRLADVAHPGISAVARVDSAFGSVGGPVVDND